MTYHAAVESVVAMQHWHPNIKEDIIAVLIPQDSFQTLPRVEVEILLK